MRRVVFNMQDERPMWAPPAWVKERLRAALPAECELVEVSAPVSGRGDGGGVSAEAMSAMEGAEIYFGLGLPRELLLAGLAPPQRLRWIHTGAAGVASLLHPELLQHGVVLTNSAGVHGPAMAETALGMVLYFARGLDHAVAAQHRGRWDTAAFEQLDGGVREIDGATLGVVGYGGIGRELSNRARAVGMRVIAARRTASRGTDADDGVEVLYGPGALATLLRDSDYVVLAVPSTPETRGLIGAPELALMRRDAVLINIARGNVLDEGALLTALQEGLLRGAALDVFATEPLPADSPLWSQPNVLVMPHVSATTPRYWQREADLMLDNLDRYFRGQPLRNVVDIAAGY
jgi:phosphoglycerate dehydrogenase-like enzyme